MEEFREEKSKPKLQKFAVSLVQITGKYIPKNPPSSRFPLSFALFHIPSHNKNGNLRTPTPTFLKACNELIIALILNWSW